MAFKDLKAEFDDIRKEIFSKLILKKKLDILFIGCGFGDEVLFFIKNYGKNHNIYTRHIKTNGAV